MNQAERIEQVKAAESTIAACNKQINDLSKAETIIKRFVARKDIPDADRADAESKLEIINAGIAAYADKRHQAKRWIEKMQGESADDGLIRVITQVGKRAEIIIHFAVPEGKKLSFTRHIRFDGSQWTGNSTVGGGYVVYRLPGESISKAA